MSLRDRIMPLLTQWDGQAESKGHVVPVFPEFLADRIERLIYELACESRDFGGPWTMDRLLLMPKSAVAALNAHDARVTELLKTNNRYLEEARAARAEARSFERALDLLRRSLKVTH